MGVGDRMKRPVNFLAPEIDEAVQSRKLRRDVVMLPDECLQQMRMVRKMIEDLRRGKAVAHQHQFRFPGAHISPFQPMLRRSSVYPSGSIVQRENSSEMQKFLCFHDISSLLRWLLPVLRQAAHRLMLRLRAE